MAKTFATLLIIACHIWLSACRICAKWLWIQCDVKLVWTIFEGYGICMHHPSFHSETFSIKTYFTVCPPQICLFKLHEVIIYLGKGPFDDLTVIVVSIILRENPLVFSSEDMCLLIDRLQVLADISADQCQEHTHSICPCSNMSSASGKPNNKYFFPWNLFVFIATAQCANCILLQGIADTC